MWSITITSVGAWIDSSVRPSCSRSAVGKDGASPVSVGEYLSSRGIVAGQTGYVEHGSAEQSWKPSHKVGHRHPGGINQPVATPGEDDGSDSQSAWEGRGADTPMPFGRQGQSLTDVEVVMTNRGAEAAGTVTDARGQTVPGCTVQRKVAQHASPGSPGGVRTDRNE